MIPYHQTIGKVATASPAAIVQRSIDTPSASVTASISRGVQVSEDELGGTRERTAALQVASEPRVRDGKEEAFRRKGARKRYEDRVNYAKLRQLAAIGDEDAVRRTEDQRARKRAYARAYRAKLKRRADNGEEKALRIREHRIALYTKRNIAKREETKRARGSSSLAAALPATAKDTATPSEDMSILESLNGPSDVHDQEEDQGSHPLSDHLSLHDNASASSEQCPNPEVTWRHTLPARQPWPEMDIEVKLSFRESYSTMLDVMLQSNNGPDEQRKVFDMHYNMSLALARLGTRRNRRRP